MGFNSGFKGLNNIFTTAFMFADWPFDKFAKYTLTIKDKPIISYGKRV